MTRRLQDAEQEIRRRWQEFQSAAARRKPAGETIRKIAEREKSRPSVEELQKLRTSRKHRAQELRNAKEQLARNNAAGPGPGDLSQHNRR